MFFFPPPFETYLDLPDMYKFCLSVGFSGEKAQILHTWKEVQAIFSVAHFCRQITGRMQGRSLIVCLRHLVEWGNHLLLNMSYKLGDIFV